MWAHVKKSHDKPYACSHWREALSALKFVNFFTNTFLHMVMELSKTDAWSHWRNDMSRTRICKSCEKPFISRGALRNHMLNNTGEKRVLGFVTSVKIVNIFCVVVHVRKRAQFPRIRATDSFWKGRLISTDSSSPFWRALALPSFFTSLIALLCQAPSDSTAMGHVKKPEPEAWSHWREANLGL